jgi:hypothetical protein
MIYKLRLSSLSMSELESVEMHYDISPMCHTTLKKSGEDLSVAILPIHMYCILFIFITITTKKISLFFVVNIRQFL